MAESCDLRTQNPAYMHICTAENGKVVTTSCASKDQASSVRALTDHKHAKNASKSSKLDRKKPVALETP